MDTLPNLPRSAALFVALVSWPLAAFQCEPEVGSLCDDDPARVESVQVAPGTDNLVTDVTMRNCTQALCLSSDGSRPYCTVACASDGDCPADEGFRCVDAAPFAANAPPQVCAGSPEIIEARDVAMKRR